MVNYLIVGQGIAGSLIAAECLRKNLSFKIIDNKELSSASRVAAGIINPITGRKFVRSWMYEELETEFVPFYRHLERLLSSSYLEERTIIRALAEVKDQNNWDARMLDPEAGKYMSVEKNGLEYKDASVKRSGYGSVRGYQLKVKELVTDFRNYLLDKDLIHEAVFQHDRLRISEHYVEYNNLKGEHIIFCEGHKVSNNPWFRKLPFAPAKGETLHIRIPDLETKQIMKDGIFITPWSKDLYWVGASYAWTGLHDQPSEEKKRWLQESLDKILKTKYKVVDQQAAVRPATKHRRPYMGTHELHHRLHLFNGLGTKGTSLGPYWARHFMDHLNDGKPLSAEVDISRLQDA